MRLGLLISTVCVLLLTQAKCDKIREVDLLHDYYSKSVPDSFKKYFEAKQFQKIMRGHEEYYGGEGLRVYYIRYYGRSFGGYILRTEGFFYGDDAVGPTFEYYPNGKLNLTESFILANDTNQKQVVSLDQFNRLGFDKQKYYNPFLHGERKFYDESGKLVKVELYDTGKLLKTTDY